jgi:hypothetical protein
VELGSVVDDVADTLGFRARGAMWGNGEAVLRVTVLGVAEEGEGGVETGEAGVVKVGVVKTGVDTVCRDQGMCTGVPVCCKA